MRLFAFAVFPCLFVVHGEEMGVLRKMSENKFGPLPGLPACATLSVESGDPSKGPIRHLTEGHRGLPDPLALAYTDRTRHGCERGSAKVQMKDTGNAAVLGPGGYAMMANKHVHQFTCHSACPAFVSSDTASTFPTWTRTEARFPPSRRLQRRNSPRQAGVHYPKSRPLIGASFRALWVPVNCYWGTN